MKIKTACENCLPISFKAFKKILILMVIHLFFISPISGQIIDIKGHVELQDNLSDPIYTVVALRSDSSIYKGSVYMDSVFSMKLETDSLIGLQFSSMGYEALFYERDNIISAIKNKTANLGTISLKSNC
ncbi:hypothetical protein, partial [Bacteroides coprosuis]|uniref:hypothetical protein n=1 Tax=Bacteroides coprosuis TaxID=151276 RepID=UPI001D87C018